MVSENTMCHPIIEMATVGIFWSCGDKPYGGERKVFITSDTRLIPHVHIWGTSTNGKELSVCVRLDKPEYFKHDGATDEFTQRDLEAFSKFMQSKYTGDATFRKGEFRTNWEYAIFQWNSENPSNKLPMSVGEDGFVVTIPMPDYTKLR